MPRQVLIEVMVAEVSLDDSTSLGIDWATRVSPSIRIQSRPLTGLSAITTGAFRTATVLSGPAGLTALAIEADKFFGMLNALASDRRLNVLSSPHILTAENKKAVINVSRSVPIITSQQTPVGGVTSTTTGTTITPTPTTTAQVVGTQSVEYRDAGVILTVTPRIGEQGTVALDVKQEVNNIQTTATGDFATGAAGSPIFIKREAETSVVLLNNQTLLIGGIIQDSRNNETRGIPWFKDIPIFGYLFGARSQSNQKTELIIMITPRVVGSPTDAGKITDALRNASPDVDQTLRRAPQLPPTSPAPPPAPSTVPAVPMPPSAPAPRPVPPPPATEPAPPAAPPATR